MLLHNCKYNFFPRVLLLWCMVGGDVVNCNNMAFEKKYNLSKANHVQYMTTSILDRLLDGYDQSMRPHSKGKPTVVFTDINIRSMGPISEIDMSYMLDCYFRQTWIDARLQFNGSVIQSKTLKLNTKMLDRMWRPDTYFLNGRGSYHHTITVPNKLLRLSPDGTVLYSMRLSIKANCPMFLRFFPIDEQICPLTFGSYAYAINDVTYKWKYSQCKMENVVVSADVKLSQFELNSLFCKSKTIVKRRGNYSVLTVEFNLQRSMRFFIIQVYIPCTLLVILSWVAFWLNREATADRVGLGITTVLTLITLSMDSRNDLPRVSYATALDVFIFMCFGFIIASLFEFAGVHYFTKFGSGEFIHQNQAMDSDDVGYEEETLCKDFSSSIQKCKKIDKRHGQQFSKYWQGPMESNHLSVAYPGSNSFEPTLDSEFINEARESAQRRTEYKQLNKKVKWFNNIYYCFDCLFDFIRCLQGNAQYRAMLTLRGQQRGGVNSVSIIDRISRLLFPVAFLIMNVAYWISYLRTDQSKYRYHHQ